MAKPAAAHWKSHVGPLYAESQDVAKLMFQYLFKNQPNVAEGVYFETIAPNAQNVKEFMTEIGIGGELFSFERQYTGKEITTAYDKIYCVSNTDLHWF